MSCRTTLVHPLYRFVKNSQEQLGKKWTEMDALIKDILKIWKFSIQSPQEHVETKQSTKKHVSFKSFRFDFAVQTLHKLVLGSRPEGSDLAWWLDFMVQLSVSHLDTFNMQIMYNIAQNC